MFLMVINFAPHSTINRFSLLFPSVYFLLHQLQILDRNFHCIICWLRICKLLVLDCGPAPETHPREIDECQVLMADGCLAGGTRHAG